MAEVILRKPDDILVIDDDVAMTQAITHLLRADYSVHTAVSGEEGLKLAEIVQPQLILLDLNLPRINGMRVLKILRRAGQNVPVMILTAYGTVETAVEAMKLGAADYIEKPFRPDHLKENIRKFLCLNKDCRTEQPLSRLTIGESAPIKAVWQLIEKFAPPDVTILLEGETGTGKELFARAIHQLSKRNKGPFITVDAAIFPGPLADSDALGHEKASFKSASEKKTGRFEWANGGTLFLDEVSNLTPRMQIKLLRMMQGMRFSPLSERAAKSADLDMRIVAATNRNLGELILSGKFREDLFYRLSVVKVQLPPLRERGGDVRLLSEHFLKVYGENFGKRDLHFSHDAAELLERYTWPGNVRELENVLKRVILVADDVILPSHLPKRFLSTKGSVQSLKENVAKADLNAVAGVEIGRTHDLKQYLTKFANEAKKELITKLTHGAEVKKSKGADSLNLDPRTIKTRPKKFGLEQE